MSGRRRYLVLATNLSVKSRPRTGSGLRLRDARRYQKWRVNFADLAPAADDPCGEHVADEVRKALPVEIVAVAAVLHHASAAAQTGTARAVLERVQRIEVVDVEAAEVIDADTSGDEQAQNC